MREGAIASAACNELCAGVGDDAEYSGVPADAARFAACFSCRCEASLGWLPPPEELKCSTGEHLERYRFTSEPAMDGDLERVTGLAVIDAEGNDTSGCLNGGMAAAGCDLSSRHKRIINGDVEFQLLCRKPLATDVGYYEYLIIGNNSTTGATCFWQARDYDFNGEDTASLDVTDENHQPIPEAVQKYVGTYYLYSTGPSTCTGCHASDAFLWSPYFASAYPTPFDDVAASRLAARYFQVSAASDRLQPVKHTFLLAGPSAPGAPASNISCTGCHRVADGTFCDSLSSQALGQSDRHGLQLFDPESAFLHGSALTFWMAPGATTHAEWLEQSADDVARLSACCTNSYSQPDADCVWTEEF